MTWQVEGLGTDFTSDVEDLLESLLSTYWDDIAEFNSLEFNRGEFNVGVASANITFDNDWYAEYNDFKISCTTVTTLSDADNLGARSYEFQHPLNVHVWVRNSTANTKTQEMGVIKANIERIIGQYSLSLGQNIRFFKFDGWVAEFPEDASQTTWHIVGLVSAYYRKTRT